jgi:hypothetical protein
VSARTSKPEMRILASCSSAIIVSSYPFRYLLSKCTSLLISILYSFSGVLYMRHNLADTGTSHTGSLADSPDIIIKNSPVSNPHATYSTPASIASDTESDPDVLTGQANSRCTCESGTVGETRRTCLRRFTGRPRQLW